MQISRFSPSSFLIRLSSDQMSRLHWIPIHVVSIVSTTISASSSSTSLPTRAHQHPIILPFSVAFSQYLFQSFSEPCPSSQLRSRNPLLWSLQTSHMQGIERIYNWDSHFRSQATFDERWWTVILGPGGQRRKWGMDISYGQLCVDWEEPGGSRV